MISKFGSTVIFTLACAALSAQPAIPTQGGPGGQIILPTADFGGTPSGFYAGKNYGLRVGVGGHGKLRFGMAGVRWSADLGYSYLYGSNAPVSGTGSIDILGRWFALRVGPEFQFPSSSVSLIPYVGGSVAVNNLGFDLTIRNVPGLADADYITNSVSRFGFGLTGGVLIPISSAVALDIGVAYHFINPFQKSWENRNPGVNKRENSYTAVNDAADPQYAAGDNIHFVSTARQIQAALLTVAVIFGK